MAVAHNIQCYLVSHNCRFQAALFWRYSVGSQTIEFNGIPFSIRKKRTLDCQYGPKYYKGRKFTGKRLCLQGTRKQGCSVNIHLTEYMKKGCESSEQTSALYNE